MTDRSTKGLLVLIAIGIWGLLFYLFIGPFPVHAAPPSSSKNQASQTGAPAITAAPTPLGSPYPGFAHMYVVQGSSVYMLYDDGSKLQFVNKVPLQ